MLQQRKTEKKKGNKKSLFLTICTTFSLIFGKKMAEISDILEIWKQNKSKITKKKKETKRYHI